MKRKIIPYNPYLKERAKVLRKNMTYSEVVLWNNLKDLKMMGYDFDRQRPILNFIVDFFSKDLSLIIEVDGITHNDEKVFEKDLVRDDVLQQLNISILRFQALDVINKTKYVLKIIENWILDFEELNGIEKP